MADTDFYNSESKQFTLEQKFNVTGKFVVSYIGTLGLANGLDYFLHCADASGKSKLPIHFILCGEGAEEGRLKKLANTMQLDNISILPFQNREGVKEVMNITDAVFISFKPLPVLETGSPNKYFDGLAAGKLIISNVSGWIKNEIESHQCGLHLTPTQSNKFLEKIKPFTLQPELLLQYQKASRKLGEEMYSRRMISKKFQELFPA
jgi:glycosyltransferase involved in cell wall biosynthesis